MHKPGQRINLANLYSILSLTIELLAKANCISTAEEVTY